MGKRKNNKKIKEIPFVKITFPLDHTDNSGNKKRERERD